MNSLKAGPVGRAVSSSDGASNSLADPVADHSCAALAIARDAGEATAELIATFAGMQAVSKQQALRVAIKVRGRILFFSLADVVAVQAKGKCVLLQRNASSYLLRESISVVAEMLETHGFIRIHRSVLVNTSFVEEIRPLSSGEYCLRVEGGKQYTVTRTYKKNLKSLADFWIGTSVFFARLDQNLDRTRPRPPRNAMCVIREAMRSAPTLRYLRPDVRRERSE